MRRKRHLLIVDDEGNIRKILKAAFERSNYKVTAVESGDEALQAIASDPTIDLVLTDVLMPGITGVELLAHVRSRREDLPVLIMTAYGTIPQAVEAMRLGAVDYITKPFDLEVLKRTVAHFLPKSGSKATKKPAKKSDGSNLGLIAESEKMKEILALVKQVADSRATVLITGESGTGKEVIAKTIHRLSPRADAAFVAVSCAALPETLLESELFGYERGAFTGADSMRRGRFEVADGGTLFLDEIGEVPPAIQVKLLRVLQERQIERLGSSVPIDVDVRLIAATNRDLRKAVDEGQFREDLFYRLQVLHIELPPLRERKEDVIPLALHFIERYAAENGTQLSGLSKDAERLLLRYSWPGNVRELENAMERAVVLAPKDKTELTPDLLPPQLLSAA
ncbi:MAG: sigma-54-dependent Fis family transcriptional regulator [Armatimonadetes bacterium]|nr:MAG: sigma-54-dependent Fis family transcriptional regulator [Armatimonadota bacterium]